MPSLGFTDSRIKKILFIFEFFASIATIAGVIGLVLVYLQLQVQEKEAKINVQNHIYEKMIDIDKFFIEHPDARSYIYSGLKSESAGKFGFKCADKVCSNQRIIELAAAELMLDFFALVMVSKEQLEKTPVEMNSIESETIKESAYPFKSCMVKNLANATNAKAKDKAEELKFSAYDDWIFYMKDMYICSPALRKRLATRPSWYINQEAISFVKCSEEALSSREQALSKKVDLDKNSAQYKPEEIEKIDADFNVEKDRCDDLTEQETNL
jgi:hypothetical protein